MPFQSSAGRSRISAISITGLIDSQSGRGSGRARENMPVAEDHRLSCLLILDDPTEGAEIEEPFVRDADAAPKRSEGPGSCWSRECRLVLSILGLDEIERISDHFLIDDQSRTGRSERFKGRAGRFVDEMDTNTELIDDPVALLLLDFQADIDQRHSWIGKVVGSGPVTGSNRHPKVLWVD